MARPAPRILLETVDKTSYKTVQILEAESIWAIFYKGKPCNIKISNKVSNHPPPKYVKCSFSNSGHAINLCKRLNKEHNCNDFQVVKLLDGELIK